MAIKAGSQALASDFTGMIWPSTLRTAPDQWYKCDGTAYSRTTESALFEALCPSSTVTMTIASPGVITWTSHPLLVDDAIVFTTTGALPTGLTAGTVYYVISVTTNTFQVSASLGGAAVNTSGSQSGVHTGRLFTTGVGDGSTTFNVPDLRGRVIVGAGTGTKVATFVSRSSDTITASGIDNAADNELQTGQAVLYHSATTVMTGLTNDTTYYLIRVAYNQFKLAATRADAIAGTQISLSSDGSGAQTFTITRTARRVGESLGEESHAITLSETPSHTHAELTSNGASGTAIAGTANAGPNTNTLFNTGAAGGSTAHNNMQPSYVLNYFIHR